VICKWHEMFAVHKMAYGTLLGPVSHSSRTLSTTNVVEASPSSIDATCRFVQRPALWLMLVVCLLPSDAARSAQPSITGFDFTKIDKHVATVQVTAADGIDDVARKIVAPSRREVERVRAIAWWMASNIAYDHDAHRVGVAQQRAGQEPVWVLPANRPAEVLRRRKAICMGYSALFVEFCQCVGIEAVDVSGHTRYSVEGHSWNAVRINGDWHLVDVSSMASGAGNQGDGRGSPVAFYFQPPPDQFIFSHFPQDPRWQLLPKPVPRSQFDSMPVVLPPLFMIGVTPESLRKAARNGVDEFVTAAAVAGESVTLLDGPLSRRLKPGESYRFRIRAPGYVGVHANDGGIQQTFEKRGGIFEATVSPRGPFLRIGVERQPKQITGILEYAVGAPDVGRLGKDVTSRINEARRRGGVGELVHDPLLDATALVHADLMSRERSTPGRARCLVAAADNPDGLPPTALAGSLVASMMQDEDQRAWACAAPHRHVGVGATTADGKTYFCIEFQ
jgi:hypothetical protein